MNVDDSVPEYLRNLKLGDQLLFEDIAFEVRCVHEPFRQRKEAVTLLNLNTSRFSFYEVSELVPFGPRKV